MDAHTTNVWARDDEVWRGTEELGRAILDTVTNGIDGVCIDVVQERWIDIMTVTRMYGRPDKTND